MTDAGTVCDFCYAPGPRWEYPCQDYAFALVVGDAVSIGESTGGWLACNPCHELIEAGRHGDLAMRSATSKDAPPDAVKNFNLALQLQEKGFRAHRTGEAVALPIH